MKSKVGRPKNSFKYDNKFYLMIVDEHNDFSISQMSKNHNVSTSTVIKWLAKGRGILNESKQPESE